jgi:hypothetical protein
MNKEIAMKTLAALAFALVATACAANEPSDGLELRHAGDTIEGSLVDNGTAIDFRITEMGHQVAIEIETRDGYKRVENIRLPQAELDVVRRLPRVLAVQGIDVESAIEATPELGQVFCPTRPSFDPITQNDALDLDRN